MASAVAPLRGWLKGPRTETPRSVQTEQQFPYEDYREVEKRERERQAQIQRDSEDIYNGEPSSTSRRSPNWLSEDFVPLSANHGDTFGNNGDQRSQSPMNPKSGRITTTTIEICPPSPEPDAKESVAIPGLLEDDFPSNEPEDDDEEEEMEQETYTEQERSPPKIEPVVEIPGFGSPPSRKSAEEEEEERLAAIEEEERLKREEESRKLEEETHRLAEEHRKAEEEKLRLDIEEQERRQLEERKRLEEEARMAAERDEQELKAREEAEKARIELEERLRDKKPIIGSMELPDVPMRKSSGEAPGPVNRPAPLARPEYRGVDQQCLNCPKNAIDNPEWDREYCSVKCCVDYCKKIFQVHVKEWKCKAVGADTVSMVPPKDAASPGNQRRC